MLLYVPGRGLKQVVRIRQLEIDLVLLQPDLVWLETGIDSTEELWCCD